MKASRGLIHGGRGASPYPWRSDRGWPLGCFDLLDGLRRVASRF